VLLKWVKTLLNTQCMLLKKCLKTLHSVSSFKVYYFRNQSPFKSMLKCTTFSQTISIFLQHRIRVPHYLIPHSIHTYIFCNTRINTCTSLQFPAERNTLGNTTLIRQSLNLFQIKLNTFSSVNLNCC